MLGLQPYQVRKYFLRSENYFSLNLPPYFDFGGILRQMSDELEGHELEEFNTEMEMKGFGDVNYRLPMRKDNGYGWREFRLIHPAVYVALVNTVTEKENWSKIQERFRLFGLQNAVTCNSLVPGAESGRAAAAAAILKWWHGIEQETVKMALFYNYMAQTDIQECYASMRPQLIAKALGARAEDEKHFGNRISGLISCSEMGHTVGIPQGNVLVDLLAELVFGYIDLKLKNAIKKEKIREEYTILRFRDDYRIFAKSEIGVLKIVGVLSEVLAEFGMKLNANKTKVYSDILSAARKPDKTYWEMHQSMMMQNGEPRELSIQKTLFAIREMAREFPNSGTVQRAMVELYKKRIYRLKHRPDDTYQIMSIVVDLMVNNPRTSQVGVAILSKMMSFNPGISRNALVDRTLEKAKMMPNVESLEIALQRLTVKNKPGKRYRNKMCQLLYNAEGKLWNSKWTSLKIHDADVLQRKVIKKMDFVVPVEEIALFRDYDEVDEFAIFRGTEWDG